MVITDQTSFDFLSPQGDQTGFDFLSPHGDQTGFNFPTPCFAQTGFNFRSTEMLKATSHILNPFRSLKKTI